MAATTVPSTLQEQKWDAKFFAEYVRESFFNEYMGMEPNDLIQVKNDLTTEAGKTITLPLVRKLQNDGVTGDNTLRGNEEALSLYGDSITVDQLRHAVVVGKMEEQATSIDIRNAGKTMLKIWSMDKLRALIINRMYSPALDGVTLYQTSAGVAVATEAQKDAWLTANSDRILFGAAVSNASSNDHSTSLGNVDSTNDDFDPAILSLSKRRLKAASVGIRPITVKKGREWFVAFAGSLPFRDFKSNMSTIHQNAQVRGDDNPLFQDGDLVYDGNIVREVPEIGVISGVGNGSIDVAPVFHCGAQSLGLAWAQKSKMVVDKTIDYENQTGIAISEIRGCKKLFFNSKQHGMGTIYVAAVADT